MFTRKARSTNDYLETLRLVVSRQCPDVDPSTGKVKPHLSDRCDHCGGHLYHRCGVKEDRSMSDTIWWIILVVVIIMIINGHF